MIYRLYLFNEYETVLYFCFCKYQKGKRHPYQFDSPACQSAICKPFTVLHFNKIYCTYIL